MAAAVRVRCTPTMPDSAKLALRADAPTRTEIALACAIGLAVVALRAPLMDLPLERDEGGYAYAAWRMTFGEWPYADVFTQKPPGVFVAYHAAFVWFGDSVASIRAMAAIFSGLSSVALFFLVHPLLGRGPALAAAALLGLLSADPMIQGSIANTELFMLPLMIAAAAVFLRVASAPRVSAYAAMAVGALLGIAVAFKQVAGIHALFFVAIFPFVPVAVDADSRWRRSAAFVGWATAGGILVWGGIAVWLASLGALRTAADAILFHNLAYASSLPWSHRLAWLSHYVQPLFASQGVAWLLAAAGLASLWSRREPFPALFLLGWALANAVGVGASGHFFPHYFQQLLPAVAAGAVGLLAAPFHRARNILVFAVAAIPLFYSSVIFWGLSPDEAMQRIYPRNPFEAMPAIAAEVAAVTSPDDLVFVADTEPEILYYARRASATSYTHLFAAFGPFGDAEERQRSVAEQVDRAQPAAIVVIPNNMTSGRGKDSFLARWLKRRIARDYTRHAVVVSTDENRGNLVRVRDASNFPQALLNGNHWAAIYVRKDGGALATPSIDDTP